MSQRSYNNPRNQARQKHGEGLKGVSRKSASSAKPARPAGSSVYTSSAKGTSKTRARVDRSLDKGGPEKDQRARQKRREQALGAQLTSMPQYKFWRRIWWVLIVVAVIAVALSFFIGQMRTGGTISESTADMLAPVLLVIGYGGIIAALIIDLGKIRRMRKDLEAQATTMSRKELRELDAAIDQSDKEYRERRAQRKANRSMPWSKKKAADDSAAATEE